VPLVNIRTGFIAADGSEEVLTQYLCDCPDCPNPAVYHLGCIPELRAMAVVCEKHVPSWRRPTRQ
jgi:hypothetical protein